MAARAHSPTTSTPSVTVPVPAWAWALAAVTAFALYLLVQDNGAVLAQYAAYVHEFTHDGRHALGVPCH